MPRWTVTVKEIYTVELDAATQAEAEQFALEHEAPDYGSQEVIFVEQIGDEDLDQ